MNTTTEQSEISRLIEIVENLNSRIAAIEASLPVEPKPLVGEIRKEKESSEDLEFRLGEQWFGKIGIVAFLFAVFYLLTLPIQNPYHFVIIAFGFAVSASMIMTSSLKKEQLKSLSGYLAGSGIIIMYFSALKLHYFSAAPVLSAGLLIPLLYAAGAAALIISLRRKSVALTVISLSLFGITALLSDAIVLFIPTLILVSAASVFIGKKYTMENITLYVIPVVYLCYFLWFINNPLTGGEIGTRNDSPFMILVIPVLLCIFGLTQILNKEPDEYTSVLTTLMNSVFGYSLFVYGTLTSNLEFPALMNFGMSLLLLFIASRHWTLQRSKISTFIYSMTGYGALSFAIILNFKAPDTYILLCWQSLLVVSTALWFRSRFIVVANFFIFFVLTAAYTVSQSGYSVAALSFGLVALISARLINIHQLRLQLESEQLRNAYLILAVLFIPFILYSILPSAVVGISWIILAFMYYVVGKLINNKKYRIMASATILMSLVYIFIFGLISGDAAYKIISFTLVSIALIIISVVYSRVRSKEAGKS